MKTYEYTEAVETLGGILAIQDKQLLAKELAKIMIKHVDLGKGWSIKDLDLFVTKDNGKFAIKIGNEE